jgi:hypothetical protein
MRECYREAGSGKREAGSGKREEGRGKREEGPAEAASTWPTDLAA